MGNKGKYLGWGNFLKTRREARFRSARELCRCVELGISYPQYSRYEAGEQIPSLEQALSIGEKLGAPALETVLEWTLAQLPAQGAPARDGLSRLLEDARGAPGSSSAEPASRGPSRRLGQGVALEDMIVFNRSHLRVFGSDPAYRDIFTYVNAFGAQGVSSDEIARDLGIEPGTVRSMLEKLSELGVVDRSGEGPGEFRSTKRVLYFPDDEDFFELRNLNFRHNADRILDRLSHADVAQRKAFRGLVTRELTGPQATQLMAALEHVLSQAVVADETPEARVVYSLCVLFGERFGRGAEVALEAGQGPGLTTQKPDTNMTRQVDGI